MKRTTGRRITLCIPETLYRNVERLADRQRTSISRLAREALEALIHEAEEAELRAAYDALGEDPELTDVELFSFAAWEVVNGE